MLICIYIDSYQEKRNEAWTKKFSINLSSRICFFWFFFCNFGLFQQVFNNLKLNNLAKETRRFELKNINQMDITSSVGWIQFAIGLCETGSTQIRRKMRSIPNPTMKFSLSSTSAEQPYLRTAIQKNLLKRTYNIRFLVTLWNECHSQTESY